VHSSARDQSTCKSLVAFPDLSGQMQRSAKMASVVELPLPEGRFPAMNAHGNNNMASWQNVARHSNCCSWALAKMELPLHQLRAVDDQLHDHSLTNMTRSCKPELADITCPRKHASGYTRRIASGLGITSSLVQQRPNASSGNGPEIQISPSNAHLCFGMSSTGQVAALFLSQDLWKMPDLSRNFLGGWSWGFFAAGLANGIVERSSQSPRVLYILDKQGTSPIASLPARHRMKFFGLGQGRCDGVAAFRTDAPVVNFRSNFLAHDRRDAAMFSRTAAYARASLYSKTFSTVDIQDAEHMSLAAVNSWDISLCMRSLTGESPEQQHSEFSARTNRPASCQTESTQRAQNPILGNGSLPSSSS